MSARRCLLCFGDPRLSLRAEPEVRGTQPEYPIFRHGETMKVRGLDEMPQCIPNTPQQETDLSHAELQQICKL